MRGEVLRGASRGGTRMPGAGIESSAAEVKKLLAQLRGSDAPHPWTLAERFQAWIGKNIKPQIGVFTGVTTALKVCIEKAATAVRIKDVDTGDATAEVTLSFVATP